MQGSTAQANTTTHSLCSQPWEQLHTLVGDKVMLHLLLHTTLFQALPNGCSLQLTGSSAGAVRARHVVQEDQLRAAAKCEALLQLAWKSSAAAPSTALALGPPAEPVLVPPSPATHMPGSPTSSEAEQLSPLQPVTQLPDPDQLEGQPVHMDEDAAGPQQPAAGNKRGRAARPSSWQRRKLARLRACSRLLLMIADAMCSDSAAAGASAQPEAPQAATQQPEQGQPQPEAAQDLALLTQLPSSPGACKVSRHLAYEQRRGPWVQALCHLLYTGGCHAGSGAAPGPAPRPAQAAARGRNRHWTARPASVTIPRAGAFYCASFSSQAGLPRKRAATSASVCAHW